MPPSDSPSTQPAAFWHAVPLQYVPYLLHTGALYAQTRLAALCLPIVPRPTATRRDKKLGLDGYVHFSFGPHTPLLADKHKKGYPHVLLQFDAQIADLPGTAYVKFNAKVLVTVTGTIKFIVSPASPSSSEISDVMREAALATA